MKFHLPKGLFMAVTTSMVGLSQPVAAETLTPLTEDGWTQASRYNKNAGNTVTIDKAAGTATLTDGWNQNQAHYDLGYTLGVTQSEALTFSITFSNLQQNERGLFAIAFVGEPKAIVLGDLDYDPRGLMYGVSYETNSDFYITSGEDWDSYTGGKVFTETITGAETTATGTAYKLDGTIAWSAEKSQYVMTLNLNDNAEPVATADLGTIVDINKISLYVDGQGATFSALEISGGAQVQYTPNNLTWNGTNGNNTWVAGSTDTPWKEGDTNAAFSHYDNVTFGELTEGMSNTVVISGEVYAPSVTINDNYTLQADGTAFLTTKNLEIAEGKTITYSGSGNLAITSDLNADLNMQRGTLNLYAVNGDVTVTGGTLNLSGKHAINGGSLSITNGTVFIEYNAASSEGSAIHKDTDVSIGAGGTLHIKGHDSMGWGQDSNKVAVETILLKGTDADNKATLKLEEQGTWDGSNSIGYGLNMQGYSDVIGVGGNNIINGASVTATNKGNTITFEKLQISKNWNITVEQDGDLAISATSTDSNKPGHIVKKGTGNLTLTGTYTNALDLEAGSVSVIGKLTGAVTVTGGELTVSGGDAISGSTLSITNGTVNVSAIDDSAIGPNTVVSVLAGGTLNASGHDMFHYNNNALPSISLQGEEGEGKMATLNIDDYTEDGGQRTAAVCTMTTMLNMQGYSQVTGNSFSSFAMDTTTGEGDNAITLTNTGVQVSGTNNIIATDEVLIRANWVLDVTNGAELEVSSVIKNATNDDKNGKLMKKGEGTLVLSGANTQTRGTIINDGMIIANNDTAMGGGAVTINKGTLQVGVGKVGSKDVNLTITGGLTMSQENNASKVALSEGSSLTLGSVKFTGSKNDRDGATITRNDEGNNVYALGNVGYTVDNAKVEVATAEGGATISNRLINVALTNTGTGTLVASNGYNTYTALVAAAGNLNICGFGVDTGKNGQGDLELLEIAAGKTMGVHSSFQTAIDAKENKATVAVSGAATFGAGANLHANLTLNNGAVLTLGEGGLKMNNSVLSLGSSLTLDSATVQRIMALAEDGVVALFTNVSELILGGETYTAGTLTADNGVALGTVFNLSTEPMPTELTAAANTSYYLGFDGKGMVYAAQIVPEPTTATLSLLALAALAARRRRR